MKRINITSSVLFLIAFGLYWSNVLFDKEKTDPNTSNAERIPDYVAEGLRNIMYNADGVVEHDLYADKMEHFEALDLTHFELPVYYFRQSEQEQPWKISANKAVLFGEAKLVLENHVLVETQDPEHHIQDINTEYLEIDLIAQQMQSNANITITGKTFTVKGNGLHADLVKNEVELTNHVETIYKNAGNKN